MRSIKELETIISDARNQQAKAHGVMESISAEWQEKYEVSTVSEAYAEAERLNAQTKKLETKRIETLAALDDLVPEA